MVDRILIVDNESKTIHLLRQVFSASGYAVISANRADRAVQIVNEEHITLVITESILQTEADGCELIRQLREFSDIPILLVSARSETNDLLNGYQAGADDVIVKPFEPLVLLAKVKALVSRYKKDLISPEVINCGNLIVNQGSREVTINGMAVYLTETEYNLLVELAKHHDQVMLHEQLLESVWGPEYRHEMDYLRSYVHILRKKLDDNTSRPSLIVSLSGIGYKLVSRSSEKPGK